MNACHLNSNLTSKRPTTMRVARTTRIAAIVWVLADTRKSFTTVQFPRCEKDQVRNQAGFQSIGA
jgi:hypothetical protein